MPIKKEREYRALAAPLTAQSATKLIQTPADGQTIESAAPSYSDLVKAEGALPMAYENGAVWCMSKKTFMEYVGMTDKNGQPKNNKDIAAKSACGTPQALILYAERQEI